MKYARVKYPKGHKDSRKVQPPRPWKGLFYAARQSNLHGKMESTAQTVLVAVHPLAAACVPNG